MIYTNEHIINKATKNLHFRRFLSIRAISLLCVPYVFYPTYSTCSAQAFAQPAFCSCSYNSSLAYTRYISIEPNVLMLFFLSP
jgi:hypothetical protein